MKLTAPDVAFEYSFGRTEDHVKADDFAPSFRNVSQKGGNMGESFQE